MRGTRLCIYVQKRTQLDPSPVFISVMKCPTYRKQIYSNSSLNWVQLEKASLTTTKQLNHSFDATCTSEILVNVC